jgi:hypothetical protein
MHNYTRCLAVGLSFAALSCAAIPTGDFGTTIDAKGRVTEQQVQASGLRISGKQVNELASPYFGMLVLTIENTKAGWRHMQHLRVSLASRELNDSVIIPAGTALEAWVDATLTNSYFALLDVGS